MITPCPGASYQSRCVRWHGCSRAGKRGNGGIPINVFIYLFDVHTCSTCENKITKGNNMPITGDSSTIVSYINTNYLTNTKLLKTQNKLLKQLKLQKHTMSCSQHRHKLEITTLYSIIVRVSFPLSVINIFISPNIGGKNTQNKNRLAHTQAL